MFLIFPALIAAVTALTFATIDFGTFLLIVPMPEPPCGDAEDEVRAALVLARERPLDRLVDALVDLLDRARQHLRAEVQLVAVDADPPDVGLLGRVEDAEAAAAGDLEHDLRALGDLLQCDLLALRLVDEVLGVAVELGRARVGGLARRR